MSSQSAHSDRDLYDDNLSLREARTRYFARNGFGMDGGYADRWVRLQFGPLTFYIPNNKGRVRAVRYHDLHHVLTGYRTDWRGEFEISAWEVASGCADHFMAWLLNLSGMSAGVWIWPRAIFRAFVRGRHSRNLYRETFGEPLLERQVGEMRGQLGLDGTARATAADVLFYLFFLLLSIPAGLVMLAVSVLALPVALITTRAAARDLATTSL